MNKSFDVSRIFLLENSIWAQDFQVQMVEDSVFYEIINNNR